jgi:hypothetical protein
VQAARQSGVKLLAAVLGLHSCGFAIGYGASRVLGLSEKVSRTNSIEVRDALWGYGVHVGVMSVSVDHECGCGYGCGCGNGCGVGMDVDFGEWVETLVSMGFSYCES